MLYKLIYKEIVHRKLNFLLILFSLTCAVTFFVSFFTANEAAKRETIRLTRDMGFNVRIIPKETDINKFWIKGYSELFMPEEYLKLFMKFKDFSFAHLTATLHKQIIWRDKEVILTGIASEIEPSGKEKTSMAFNIEPGTVYVGYELAEDFQISQEDFIEIYDRQFRVVKTLAESGSKDDIRIYGLLSDFQDMLGLQGQINEIMALNCLCVSPDKTDPLKILRDQLDQVLPQGKLIMDTTIATARERQRHMLEQYFSLITVFLIIIIAIWISILTMINIKDREQEIGILSAIGYRGLKIAGLFIGKIFFIGVLSSLLGYLAGTILAMEIGPEVFKITANAIKPIKSILFYSIIVTPLFAVVATILPIMLVIIKDPAIILRKK